LRHALPNIIEGKLLPAAVFIMLLQVFGTGFAVLGALAWTLSAMSLRVVRKRPIPMLLWLTTVALTVRTAAALATGSVVIYFLQPTVTTWVVGAAFIASVPLRRPLAERIALDFCPLDPDARAHPLMRRFFNDVSLWWGFTSMVNFAITLWLLLSHSPTTFVLVKSFLGPVTSTVTLGVAFLWLRGLMRRSGTEVVFAPHVAVR
jgi:hypothetical protein